MLDVLADTQAFACEAELLLDGFEGRDQALGVVGAVEVPGVEAGEVLQGAEELVAADWGEEEESELGKTGKGEEGGAEEEGEMGLGVRRKGRGEWAY